MNFHANLNCVSLPPHQLTTYPDLKNLGLTIKHASRSHRPCIQSYGHSCYSLNELKANTDTPPLRLPGILFATLVDSVVTILRTIRKSFTEKLAGEGFQWNSAVLALSVPWSDLLNKWMTVVQVTSLVYFTSPLCIAYWCLRRWSFRLSLLLFAQPQSTFCHLPGAVRSLHFNSSVTILNISSSGHLKNNLWGSVSF